MTDDYERRFSRIRAPYTQSVSLVICDDVFDARKNTASLQLSVDCANVDRICDLKSLKRVHCNLHKESLKPLSQLPHLEHLQLTLPKTADIPSLKVLNGIRTLVLLCNRHQEDLTFLRGLTSIRSLCVSNATSVKSLNPIASITGLQELYFDGSVHGIGKVRSFSPLANLHDLRFAVLLVRSMEKRLPLRHLHQLKKLEYLHLASQFAYDTDALDSLLLAVPQLDKVEFNGSLTWKNKTRRTKR